MEKLCNLYVSYTLFIQLSKNILGIMLSWLYNIEQGTLLSPTPRSLVWATNKHPLILWDKCDDKNNYRVLWLQRNLGLGVRWWVKDSYCFKIRIKEAWVVFSKCLEESLGKIC